MKKVNIVAMFMSILMVFTSIFSVGAVTNNNVKKEYTVKEKGVIYTITVNSKANIKDVVVKTNKTKDYEILLIDLKNNKIDLITTDYMKLKTDLPILSLKHGDATSFSIACASILAKVTRDRYMKDIDQKYPQYEFAKHKGYPTKRHLELLDEYGPLSDFYRFSYGPLKKYRK